MDRISITDDIFTKKPTYLFAEKMGVSPLFWENMYLRYKYLGYSKRDLKEWFELKALKPISRKTIYRYIIRQEIYDDAHLAVKKGAKIVTTNYFKRNKRFVVNPESFDQLIDQTDETLIL